jgi:hypothetical protein
MNSNQFLPSLTRLPITLNQVIDTTPPVQRLLGDSFVKVLQYTTFSDPGVQVTGMLLSLPFSPFPSFSFYSPFFFLLPSLCPSVHVEAVLFMR